MVTATTAVTVKVTALVVPPAVVAVMDLAPVVAVAAMARVAVIWVAVTTGVPVMVMPAGTATVAPVRLVPAMVTGTLAPWAPEAGVMLVSVGAAAAEAPVPVRLTLCG